MTEVRTSPSGNILDIVGGVTSVFGRGGEVVAELDDYAASQVDNDSGVAGATVKDALNTLAGSSSGMPLATMQNVTVAGPTNATDTDNTHTRVSFAGAATIALPMAPNLGAMITVMDVSGAASGTNTITTTGPTINGVNVIAAPFGSLTFLCVNASVVEWDSV